jgi:hypothetical protein
MTKYRIVTHLPCTADEYLVLKDDPEYVAFQLGVVGATEVSRVLQLGDDGFVTQTIVNRPNVVVPRIVRPLLRGKAIEFKDVRRFRDGTQRTVPFVAQLSVSNSISDRVDQRGVITVRNVVVDPAGALRPAPPPPRDGEGEIDLTAPDLCASRVATGAVGDRVCEIECVGEVTCRVGPFSRKAEEVVVHNMRGAYGRFPKIMAEWNAAREARAREGTEGRTSTARSAAEASPSPRTPGGEVGARRSVHAGGKEDGDGDGDGDGDRDEGTSRATRWWRALAPARVRAVVARARESLAPGWGPGTPPGRDASKRAGGRDDITYPDDEYLF